MTLYLGLHPRQLSSCFQDCKRWENHFISRSKSYIQTHIMTALSHTMIAYFYLEEAVDDCNFSWYLLIGVAFDVIGGGGGNWFGGDKLPLLWDILPMFRLGFPWLLREEFEPECDVVEDADLVASMEFWGCWFLLPKSSIGCKNYHDY